MNAKHARRHYRGLASVIVALAVMLVAVTAGAVTKEEIVTLTKLGISEAEIIKTIEKDRTIFDLKIQDILELKQAGVPEGVIKFMLSTPQRFAEPETPAGGEPAAATPAPAPAPAPAAPAAPEMTEEEKRAEAERMAREAARLKKEMEEAREMQRKAFADAQLKKAMAFADAGDFVAAIQEFQDFLAKGGYGPGTEEYYRARFGIAYALTKSDLFQAAARMLVDVLLEGPDKPFFQSAFYELRRLRKKINYSPPDLEELTTFSVSRFSQPFQDEYNYLLGEFFFEYGNYDRAITYLDAVSQTAPDYPKALYLKGIYNVRNNMFRSAVEAFQNAIVAAEELGAEPVVQDDGYLALARIAYEVGDYDAAIYYYRKVRQDSPKLPVAFYESAWTYFVKGDYSRALGTFQTLHGPYFDHFLFPELWILEATIYLNMCHYDYAREAIGVFKEKIATLGLPLRRFMDAQRTPADYFTSFAKAIETEDEELLPEPLTYPVLGNVEFYNLYRTYRQVEDEIARLEAARGPLGELGTELLEKLQQIRQSRLNETGIKIQQILKGLDSEIQEYVIKVKEIEVDLLDVASSSLTQEQAEIFARQEREALLARLETFARRGATDDDLREFIDGQEILRGLREDEIAAFKAKQVVSEATIKHLYSLIDDDQEEGGAIAIVGADSLEWPFEGEYWSDEVGGFRSFLREVCTK